MSGNTLVIQAPRKGFDLTLIPYPPSVRDLDPAALGACSVRLAQLDLASAIQKLGLAR